MARRNRRPVLGAGIGGGGVPLPWSPGKGAAVMSVAVCWHGWCLALGLWCWLVALTQMGFLATNYSQVPPAYILPGVCKALGPLPDPEVWQREPGPTVPASSVGHCSWARPSSCCRKGQE